MKVEVNPGYHVPTGIRKKPFYPGEQFDLDDKEAKRLIGLGVVKGVTGEAGGSSNAPPQLNAPETVKLVLAAETLDALDAFKDDTRKTVQDAFAKRKAELTPPVE
jgi:hypothetical protein